ncbi:MAG: tyrosine-type recombinase/integrase [Acidimicrobiales bacterium]
MSALAPIMEGFFTERLIGQRRASPHTVASYRDAFRLLLAFAQDRIGKAPSKLALEDLDAVVIGAFLDHLGAERHNSVRTRNNRLAAIYSLFAYATLRHPEHAALIQQVLAIPAKRTDRQLIAFLADDEVDALLAAPDRDTWVGRRDHALLLVAVQTGLRVSELTALTRADIELAIGAHLRCHG